MASSSILESTSDTYNGVTVQASTVDRVGSPGELVKALALSLEHWRADGKRAVWLSISKESARRGFIAPALHLGFELHHVVSGDGGGGVVLNGWLPVGADAPENRCPPGPQHFFGVGGFVYDAAQDAVLAVQENSGPTAGRGIWKLPGGLVDAGEDVHAAARREVREECGVDADFVSLCTVQEMHRARGASRAGCSDVYAIALMRPSRAGQVPMPQEAEIARCEWMKLDHFLAQPYIADKTAMFGAAMNAVASAARALGDGGGGGGLAHEQLPLRFMPGSAALYRCTTISSSVHAAPTAML
tara:strand:- start:209 stop:1111 length:903 start_codon:yes stop_codon:yes gene_type:complete